jgi:hypothetical protein
MFRGCLNGGHQYKHGLSRRYLFLDDEGRAYEAAGRKEFREIPLDEALARVEAPLKELARGSHWYDGVSPKIALAVADGSSPDGSLLLTPRSESKWDR